MNSRLPTTPTTETADSSSYRILISGCGKHETMTRLSRVISMYAEPPCSLSSGAFDTSTMSLLATMTVLFEQSSRRSVI
jgi:hypothetical protein